MRAICFIVEKTMPPPTSRDLHPAAAVVVVVAVVAVVSSEAESCRHVLTTQIGFVAVPVAMAVAQRCT